LVLLAGTLATGTHRREGGGAVTIVLSTAPSSFDDQYLRCHFNVMRALPALSRTEFVPAGDFAEAWSKAAALWPNRWGKITTMRDLRTVSYTLLAYTMEEGLYPEFNRATRVAGRSRREYLRSFPFQVLHFLLTEALKDVRSARGRPRCLHVYRGVTVRSVAGPGRIVRFGQFASSSLLRNVSASYGTGTVFEVDACYGAEVRHFSSYPEEEEEVLIPPFETFRVTNVTHRGKETHIQLRSHGVHSNYSWAWLRGDVPGAGTLQWGGCGGHGGWGSAGTGG
ncbi:NARE ribosyltransferase, partial [Paradoxornis webbianus]|nr:NARE ribosyltransferase [Sinosuthora webbiana]